MLQKRAFDQKLLPALKLSKVQYLLRKVYFYHLCSTPFILFIKAFACFFRCYEPIFNISTNDIVALWKDISASAIFLAASNLSIIIFFSVILRIIRLLLEYTNRSVSVFLLSYLQILYHISPHG